MKRRFKLISSIASLTLAVALLAVGVFAAGNREVTVGGTVAFTSVGVDAQVQVSEGYGTEGLTVVQAGEASEFVFSTDADNYLQGGYDYEGLAVTYPLGDEIGEPGSETQQYVYSYEVKITNKGKKEMFVKIVFTEDEESEHEGVGKTYSINGNPSGNIEDIKVEADDDIVLLVTYTVTPGVVTQSSFNWSFKTTINLATTTFGE